MFNALSPSNLTNLPYRSSAVPAVTAAARWKLDATISLPSGMYVPMADGNGPSISGDWLAFAGYKGREEEVSDVYLYKKTGGKWLQKQTIKAPKKASSWNTIALDGNILMILDELDVSGRIFVYGLSSGDKWSLKQTLGDPKNKDGFFGSVTLSNGTMLSAWSIPDDVNARNEAPVYTVDAAGKWSLRQKLALPFKDNEYYGSASWHGNVMAIGVSDDAVEGAAPGVVAVYKNNKGTWTKDGIIKAPNQAGQTYSYPTSILATEGGLFISAEDSDAAKTSRGDVWLFTEQGSSWKIAETLPLPQKYNAVEAYFGRGLQWSPATATQPKPSLLSSVYVEKNGDSITHWLSYIQNAQGKWIYEEAISPSANHDLGYDMSASGSYLAMYNSCNTGAPSSCRDGVVVYRK